MKTFPQLLPASLMLVLASCRHYPEPIAYKGYVVDSRVKQRVNSKVSSYKGLTMSSMDFKLFENDSVVADTYANGKGVGECITMTSLEGDTLTIAGYLGMTVGFGFQIELFRDTCIVIHFAKSDAEIYKLQKTDSLEFGVNVPCQHYTLTLSEKPNFKKGQVLEGLVELNSEDYFEVANGQEKKYHMQLTGYFRTDPIK